MQATSRSATGVEGAGYRPTAFRSRGFCVARNENGKSDGVDSAYSRCALRAFPGALKRGLGRGPDGPRRVFKDVHAFGALAPCEPRLQPSVLHPIIDIAASSVAHYGPVEVLRPPVGRPRPTTRPLSLPTHEGERAHRRLSNAYPSTLYPVYSVRVVPIRPPSRGPRQLAHDLTSSPREVTHDT